MGASCLSSSQAKTSTSVTVSVKTQVNPINKPQFFNFKGEFVESESSIERDCVVVKKQTGFDVFTTFSDFDQKAELELKLGDIVKISNFFFKLEEICLHNAVLAGSKSELPTAFAPSLRNAEALCKICYEPETEESNPILVPCQCQGSIKYIHAECLRNWITKSNGFLCTKTSMRIRKASYVCSICKSEYFSGGTKVDSTVADLFVQNTLPAPFLKFSLREGASNPVVQTLIQSVPADGNLIIGRKQTCNVILDKDNISREHTRFRLHHDGRIFVEDLGSTFGTLRCVAKPIVLTPRDKDVEVEMFNQVFTFKGKFGHGRVSLDKKKSGQGTSNDIQKIIKQYQNGPGQSNTFAHMHDEVMPQHQATQENEV